MFFSGSISIKDNATPNGFVGLFDAREGHVSHPQRELIYDRFLVRIVFTKDFEQVTMNPTEESSQGWMSLARMSQ